MKQPSPLLSDFAWSGSPKYRGVLLKDLALDLRRPQWTGHGDHQFYDGEKRLVTLRDSTITIHQGYASDLCSPAMKIGPWWIGTPTTRREALAAFVHDALRQILGSGLPCVPWNRKDTDDIFYELLREARSPFAGLYHAAVAGILGTTFMRLTCSRSTIRCGTVSDVHSHPR